MISRICRVAVLFLFLCFCLRQASGRSFYINATSGDDSNSGRSPRYAWKTLRQVNITTFEPGDTILFRSGQEWLGMLFPRGSGTAEHPVVITKYGGMEKPKIHGGHSDPVNFEGNYTIQTVLLHNQQHWVISDLEITNMPDNIIENFDDNGYEKRRGIYVVASDTGELKGITIKNNYVHHVKGDDTKDFNGSGGIVVAVLGKEKPSFFNGIRILNNKVYMVNRTGIGVSSYWQRRPSSRSFPDSWMDQMGPYQANLDVVIRGNHVESVGGDGIVPQSSFKALIEYNRVNGAASRSEGYNAGLWAWNSDSVLIQYNEVWNTRTVRDGMAFDCDAYSVGHTYRYNYSHDNKGGFILLFGHAQEVPDAQNIGHTICYNISMNDGNALIHFYGSGHTQSVIHNNLFYNVSDKVFPMRVEGNPLDVRIHSNIFYMRDLDEWLGINHIGEIDISDNVFLDIYHIPGSEDNFIRTPTLRELHELLNHAKDEKLSGIAITPGNIQQLWESILRKQIP